MSRDERHSFSLTNHSLFFSWSLSSTEVLSMMSHFFLHPVPQSCKMSHFCLVFIPLGHYKTLMGLIYFLILNFQCLWTLKSLKFFAILLFPKAFLLGSFLTSFSCVLLGPFPLHGFHNYLRANESQMTTFSSRPRFPNYMSFSGPQLIVTWKFEHLKMKQITSETICLFLIPSLG